MIAIDFTAPCPKFVQKFQTLPPQLRPNIFRRVFWKGYYGSGLISVKKLNSNLTFIPNENCERDKAPVDSPVPSTRACRMEHCSWGSGSVIQQWSQVSNQCRVAAGVLAKYPFPKGVWPGSLIRKISLKIAEDNHLSVKDETSKAYGELIGLFLMESRNSNDSQEELSGMYSCESAGRPSWPCLASARWKSVSCRSRVCCLYVGSNTSRWGALRRLRSGSGPRRSFHPYTFAYWAKTSLRQLVPAKNTWIGISVQISNTRFTTFHISSQSLLDSTTAGPMNRVKLRVHLNPAHPSVSIFWKSRGLPQRNDLTYDRKRIIHQSKPDDWLRDLLVRLWVLQGLSLFIWRPYPII